MTNGICLCLAVYLAAQTPPAADPAADSLAMAAKIDEFVGRHWQAAAVEPTETADDAAFLRRLSLDLVGRIPTRGEAQSFLADAAPYKRATAVRNLLASPEFAIHFANVLDDILQGRYAGDGEFLAYLRESLQHHKPWNEMFRELLLGPWDTPERKRADRFLARRVKNLDELTNDASRVFFGVDISCAKCHDHPLVDDWKQDHYYGLASFFNRSYEFRGQDQLIGEKDAGDVEFVTRAGENRKARLMFLSGQLVEEPPATDDPERKTLVEQAKQDKRYLPPLYSRRERFVRVALEDRRMFSRAMTNRVWAYLLGRGLVHPVDQMHSANEPAVEGLLDWLAEDFAAHGYQLERLVGGIVTSRVYQLSSHWPEGAARPPAEQFAVAPLRALSPKQYAVSFELAVGDESFDDLPDAAVRSQRHKQFEDRAGGMVRELDLRTDDFQSSTTEALFMSNHPAVQQLLKPEGRNLVARLLETPDDRQLIELAVWTIFSRPPSGDEPSFLAGWLAARSTDRAAAARDLTWALLTSAEFRFNH